ncbi:hypothetical protein NOC27_2983 [Nitrosococcus oceani AFC27]|nr:hypothetical protein NOC27_2983 [Nitrosococcus oceani AFC27]
MPELKYLYYKFLDIALRKSAPIGLVSSISNQYSVIFYRYVILPAETAY